MGLRSCTIVLGFLLLLSCFCLDFGAAEDIITTSQFIKDPESIVSPGNVFKLGFFSPVNSTNRYVGIWYNNFSAIAPVWVANRNKPLGGSSGIFTISDDGNLVVLNGQQQILWSSNVSIGVANSSAKLTDDGNLVLQDSSTGSSLWESFKNPSNTFLPNMRLSANRRTGERTLLTSWTNASDPSTGKFSLGIAGLTIPEVFIWSGSVPYWRTGPWGGSVFIGVPEMVSFYLDGFDLVDDGNGTSSLSLSIADKSSFYYFVLASDGNLAQTYWDNEKRAWEYIWKRPETACDVYGRCGVFGVCNPQNSQICSCLRGYEPKNIEEWSRGNWTSGCVKRRLFQCERIQANGAVGKEDGFVQLEMIKVPDFAVWSSSLQQKCGEDCLNNCSCIAYAYHSGIGCMSWTRNLIDMQKFSSGGATLYVRLADSELDKKGNRNAIIIIIMVTVGVTLIAACAFFSWRWMAKHRANSEGKRDRKETVLPERTYTYTTTLDENVIGNDKHQELPLFKLEELAIATGNFDVCNKLGQGGFGPVYKGKLPNGEAIAVKRLSRASGQGLEEFMNEVVVISKLQHRNLVRLLGCCVEGEEKMLVYEFMPNKSLDTFLFGAKNTEALDWKKRFNIIQGICRGLLYLHRDSRLRIIHRDLKASNILLDKELNPKISDFGMARIFVDNEDQGNTKRVVGTYGYMSPEYAMHGRFSEKSDLFSFGVLLLEIISGRRNTSFYGDEHALSLLGFVWKLWNVGNLAAIVDPVICDPRFQIEIFRCIHVGLLCVQELVRDRPSASTAMSMLNSEIADLPAPKRPAFTERQIDQGTESSKQSQKTCSTNNVTITLVQGR